MFDEFLRDNDLSALLLDGEMRCPFPPRSDRERWDALPDTVRHKITCLGDEAKTGYPMLTATQFLAFTRTGDRQANEQPYFERRRRLMYAVLAECVANDGSYLDAIIDGLWCICEESAWVVSAHNGSSHPGARPAAEHPLPDVQNPYIDLFCAQTAATLCYALYFTGDELDAVSPLIARRVRLELENRVFLPFMTRDDFWWMGMIRQDLNNWTPWILSNIIDAMLMEMRDRPRLVQGLSRAMRMLDSYLAVMPADGGCDEGCGYWNMAGGSLLDCLELLHRATGGRADFYGEPLIRLIGAFPVSAHIQGSYYWNFADCDAKPKLDGERLYRYGWRTQNAALMALGAQVFDIGRVLDAPDTPQMNRVLHSLFADMRSVEPVADAGTVSLPCLQVFAWRYDGLYVAVKGGNNGESHNHNDVGTLLAYVDGEPWLVDAGNMVYTAKTFSDQRYTLWNTRSRNHNLPLIGDAEQCAGRKYAAQSVRADATGASMELQAAYQPDCGLTRYVRELALNEHGFTLADTLTLAQPKPVTWVFMLRQKPELESGALAAAGMRLEFSPQLTAACEEIPVTDARMAANFPGSLWRVTLAAPSDSLHQQRFIFKRS